MKKCSKCKEIKSLDEFKGKNYYCTDCNREYLKQWKDNNINCAQGRNSDFVLTIAIKGSLEVKGTYFHPSIVTEVLAWVCSELK